MYCLLEVVSVCPEKLALRFVDKIDWIKVSIFRYYLIVRFVNFDIYCAVFKYQDILQHHKTYSPDCLNQALLLLFPPPESDEHK